MFRGGTGCPETGTERPPPLDEKDIERGPLTPTVWRRRAPSLLDAAPGRVVKEVVKALLKVMEVLKVVQALTPSGDTTPCVTSLRSSYTGCKVTLVILHGVVSPDG